MGIGNRTDREIGPLRDPVTEIRISIDGAGHVQTFIHLLALAREQTAFDQGTHDRGYQPAMQA